MPSTTVAKLLPYPLGTDRLMDGDDQIRKLAQSVDNMVQVGRVTIPITTAATPANVTLTFSPAFANASIFVVATMIGTTAISVGQVAVSSIAANQCVISGVRSTGTAPFDAFVIAVGPVAAVA